MPEIDKEKLRDKLVKMPQIRQTFRKVVDKKGRNWYVLETRITQFLSPLYVEKVMKGDGRQSTGKDFI